MTVFRCKMCGGDLEVTEGASICTCEFCGTKQTIPTVKDEGLQALFNRANVLRMKSEFDKAAEVYEKILQRSETEAEAYWGLILCKYGIEYVEDPKTLKRIPTCHRASYDAVVSDEDYRNALKYADEVQRGIYEQQAAEIDAIQKGIIALAQKEDPYDVFICYKETDENGKRTQDSVIANDIYYQLTHEGFKVFYAAITLEDKLGTEYEPYIFSALNTAKVMLSLGTKPEYFNAVWVKNEWSRFLKIMKKDRGKMLIPCYRDMDPYELPEEFAHLQAQDMSKIGFISDLVRGIKKVITKDSDKPKEKETVVIQQGGGSTTANAQIQRGNMSLEDHEWDKADSFFEEALNLDPQCAEGYLGKLLAREKKTNFDSWQLAQEGKYSFANTERLIACLEDTAHISKMAEKYALTGYLDEETIKKEYEFDRSYISELSFRRNQKERQLSELENDRLLIRVKQYAKGDTKKQVEDTIAKITAVLDERISDAGKQDKASIARVKKAYEEHLALADKKAAELNADALNRQEQRYQDAVALMKNAGDIPAFEKAAEALKAMDGYKDSSDLVENCRQAVARAAKKKKTIIGCIVAMIVIAVAAYFVVTKVVIPNNNYNAAVALMESGDYEGAIAAFDAMNGYKDSADQISACEIAGLPSASVGDTIYFGSYEQDNDVSNGKEAIEWIVLAKEENRILVISKYVLDCQKYNSSSTNVTWESCSLRTWMNSTFLSEAFTDAEQDYIPTVTVTSDDNPEYSTSAGNDTQDQIFLLSIAEAEKYFSSDSDRMCVPTAYAIAQGASASSSYLVNGRDTCWWWLRTLGRNSSFAALVLNDGSVRCSGSNVDIDHGGVRPAMWINLES